MKLKSLRIACNCINYDLAKMKCKDISLYNMTLAAREDIQNCIKFIEEKVAELEKERTDIEGIGWAFPTTISAEYSMKYLEKNTKGK